MQQQLITFWLCHFPILPLPHMSLPLFCHFLICHFLYFATSPYVTSPILPLPHMSPPLFCHFPISHFPFCHMSLLYFATSLFCLGSCWKESILSLSHIPSLNSVDLLQRSFEVNMFATLQMISREEPYHDHLMMPPSRIILYSPNL